ncbi:MAG: S9 family peptidase [Thermoanaerobaculia bacterium]
MRRAFLVLFFLLSALPAFAQKKQLTLDLVDDPTKRVLFSGAIQSGFQWLDDDTFMWPRRNEKVELVEWRLFDVKTKKEKAFFDRAKIEAALKGAGLSAEAAKEAAGRSSFTFDAKKSAFVFAAADDLFVYSFARGTVSRLTSAPGKEEIPTFSPDGQRVAFVRANDLYVVDLAGRERRLTTDGSKEILNGRLDWVYQEEVYGRGQFTGYWWSPDSSKLAFMQLDERPVPEFTVVDHIPYRLDLEVYDYPKAGDPNPRAKLFTVAAMGGVPQEIDLEKYSAGEFLIVNADWTEDSKLLTFQVQDREQTWLDLNTVGAKGEATTLFRETTKAWVDPIDNPVWLKDGTFLWQSERSGWRHVYHYKADGTQLRQVTNGEWEVRTLHGIDEKNGVAYFSGTERSPIGGDVYAIRLDGSSMKRLSEAEGTHSATFNPSFTMYVDKWGDIRTPDQIRLHRADGAEIHLVEANRVAALAEYDLPQPEFLQVKARDGFVMEAMMIRPPNFDPKKKYPVYQYLYAGPHSQTVRNAWGRGMQFLQLVAQQGIIVWQMDNRSASGKGAVSAWAAYKNLGTSELRDLEDGVAWLASQPYVDASKIMIHGWSYGGFMVSYAMTHSKSFAAGIAGGSVTDWRDYDSIYTERFMLMPQNNPEGYRKAAPRFAAKELHGNLLLIHGTIDENVHMQNTLQFAFELQKAGKQFDLMLYPKSRHGVSMPALRLHMQKMIFEFVKREMLGK